MKNVVKLFLVAFVVFSAGSLLAQDAPVSTGPAPYVYNTVEPSVVFGDLAATSRVFSIQAASMTSSQWRKYFAGTPGTSTVVGPIHPYFLGCGDQCGASGSQVIYCIQQVSPYELFSVDTTAGTITNLGMITGILPGHSAGGVTSLAWDATTNTAYVVSTSITESQLYTFNLTTRVATPVGSVITNAPGIIALGCNPGGSLFAIDLVNDNLWRLNKTTGAATLVGSLGYGANYGQDADFDPRDGIFYWAAIGTGVCQFRTIDTATGMSTLVGNLTGFTQGLATILPYASGPALANDYAVGPFLSLPTSFTQGTAYNIKAKVQNAGTNNQTNVPIKFFVGSTQAASVNLSLNAGAVDSVSFNWTPAASGDYTLAIVSALSNDEYRGNDTVRTTIHAYPQGTFVGCVGTGTTAAGWPFYTFYHDSRTDMLYLGSELGFGVSDIQRIGFEVTAVYPQVMNGFNIKMQNTTLTTISGFTSSGWTTVYTGTYSVPGTGWQWIDLQNQFAYNGTNLLIEICFDNIEYTSNSTVNSTPGSGMTYHYHMDNGAGCTMTGTNSATSRPNICILTIVGSQNQNNEVPKVFSLSQNYPNPFNPSTVINFSIPKTSMVNLVVYDVLGREVMTLVNDVMQPGEYNALFDASALSSGVYFYRIEAGTFTDSKKMLLVK